MLLNIYSSLIYINYIIVFFNYYII